MNVHFSLAAQRHDKAAHSLLSKHGLVLCISHDQVISRDSLLRILCVLLEHLTLFELLDISDDHCFILHEFDFLFERVFLKHIRLLTHSNFDAELGRCTVRSLGPLGHAEEPGDPLGLFYSGDLVKLVELDVAHIGIEVGVVLPSNEIV